MENEKIEKRYLNIRAAESEEDRTISGEAIVFNTESQVLSSYGEKFTEIIKPEAVTEELLKNSDILMLYNHEDEMIPLARSRYGSGTLKYKLNPENVAFNFDARKTAQGDEILAAVRSGDLDQCSFSFIVAEGGDNWMIKPDGSYLRVITKIEALHDFSIVHTPAYVETSCRSLEKFKEMRNQPPPPPAEPPAPPATPPAEPPAPPAPDPIDEYYAGIDATVEKLKSVDGSYPDTPAGVEAYYKELDASVQQIAEPPAES